MKYIIAGFILLSLLLFGCINQGSNETGPTKGEKQVGGQSGQAPPIESNEVDQLDEELNNIDKEISGIEELDNLTNEEVDFNIS